MLTPLMLACLSRVSQMRFTGKVGAKVSDSVPLPPGLSATGKALRSSPMPTSSRNQPG